jgi:hypothetical protein
MIWSGEQDGDDEVPPDCKRAEGAGEVFEQVHDELDFAVDSLKREMVELLDEQDV